MISFRRSAFQLSIRFSQHVSKLFCIVFVNNAKSAYIYPGFSFDSFRLFLGLRRLDGAVPIIKAKIEAP